MVRNMLARPTVRFTVDALTGLAVFGGLTLALLGPSAATGFVMPASGGAAGTGAVMLAGLPQRFTFTAESAQAQMLILAGVFSTLFALNLAFVRHLKRATAATRGRNIALVARKPVD